MADIDKELQRFVKRALRNRKPRKSVIARATVGGWCYGLLRVRADEPELSLREREVCALVAEGLTNVEIGEALGISRATVATHLRKAFTVYAVTTRTELARKCLLLEATA
jgi:DNA-binding CsgD family transcriptional regulator